MNQLRPQKTDFEPLDGFKGELVLGLTVGMKDELFFETKKEKRAERRYPRDGSNE